MIRINIICIGKIKEKYFTDAISEYAKRLTAFCKFSVTELAEEKIRNNNPNQAEIFEVIEVFCSENSSLVKNLEYGSSKLASIVSIATFASSSV